MYHQHRQIFIRGRRHAKEDKTEVVMDPLNTL